MDYKDHQGEDSDHQGDDLDHKGEESDHQGEESDNPGGDLGHQGEHLDLGIHPQVGQEDLAGILSLIGAFLSPSQQIVPSDRELQEGW